MFEKRSGIFTWRASAELSIFPIRNQLTLLRSKEPSPRHFVNYLQNQALPFRYYNEGYYTLI
jgi:hypothetical protein